ncbi:kinase-like domain-containing protein [Rhizophagus diaphanus]|nr:kinase-like domain-containing protein [Rhizophagus diaphanus] [Rhizophagus sp. MUCL 43196]
MILAKPIRIQRKFKRLLKRILKNKETNLSETGWLESTSKKYDYSGFKDIQMIGRGSSGVVSRAVRKNKFFALKTFDKDKTAQIVRELKLHKLVNLHENILRFYGYTKIDTDAVYQMNKYCLVLEYADSGTLNTYLNEHFNELDWNDKFRLALQLANAVSHLHDNNIIHCDLHANNILIHQKTVKLADFGLSKRISNEISSEESNETNDIFGVIPYIDPKCFSNKNYELNKKSDVYSVGVIMWQISSGHKPFRNNYYDIRLSTEISNGLREKTINGTPVEYSDLYKDCWSYEPVERPNIQEVVIILDQLKTKLTYKKTLLRVNKIDSKDLANPKIGKSDDRRGEFIVKKIYKGQEVACKSISNNKEEMKTDSKSQRLLEILIKISECKYILRFYGISTVENHNVMVFEWAELGNLRQLYLEKQIQWHCKVRIVLGICRGLTFLQENGILHNDLKCKNILMAESLEPKIYNFESVRYSCDENTTNPVADNKLHWIAPEILTASPYTIQSEIFSFGMLFWELIFEKIPYKGWEAGKIRDHVINGGREKFLFETSTPEIYKKGFKKIISETWKKEPQERISSFTKLLDMLEDLYNSIRCMFDENSLGLLLEKNLDLDDELELPDEDICLYNE